MPGSVVLPVKFFGANRGSIMGLACLSASEVDNLWERAPTTYKACGIPRLHFVQRNKRGLLIPRSAVVFYTTEWVDGVLQMSVLRLTVYFCCTKYNGSGRRGHTDAFLLYKLQWGERACGRLE